MNNLRGFLEIERKDPGYRSKSSRIKDFKEVEKKLSEKEVMQQAKRCMDCGIPFCHGCGCPLANLIPEWNDLVRNGHWQEALELLLSTNNFPEFTGRICPAPCETACTVGINGEPVTIRQIEISLVEKGFKEGFIKCRNTAESTGMKVAVVGSGPAGLTVADQLNKMGHNVSVYEQDISVGGLLRYGIPDFKLDKKIIDRRINLMIQEGVNFETDITVGKDISLSYLHKRFNAVCLACGARKPRDLPIPGRDFKGIHFAMDYLKQQNQRIAGEPIEEEKISAKGKNVVVIGGGDTGSDCVGTAIRQGAKSVTQLEIMPKPPKNRSEYTPWPEWPYSLRTSSSHKEGCKRHWNILSKEFKGDKNGHIEKIIAKHVQWSSNANGMPGKMTEPPDNSVTFYADLVLLSMGFTGAKIDFKGIKLDSRGNVLTDKNGMTTQTGFFAVGDVATGASLVVRAIANGRNTASSIDAYLRKQR